MEINCTPPVPADIECNELLTIAEIEDAAIKTLAELDSNSRYSLKLKLRIGMVLCIAKDILPHGDFGKWAEERLNRKETYCAAHMRLWHDRAVLEEALLWAAQTGHRWTKCCSVDRILTVIADWKKRDKIAAPAEAKPKKVRVCQSCGAPQL